MLAPTELASVECMIRHEAGTIMRSTEASSVGANSAALVPNRIAQQVVSVNSA
jgi:hypothetical protein